jgi:hypothetical protein
MPKKRPKTIDYKGCECKKRQILSRRYVCMEIAKDIVRLDDACRQLTLA